MAKSVLAWRAGGLLAVSILVAGCSSVGLSSDRIDYKSVAPTRSLDIPPDLSQLPRDDRLATGERPGVATASGLGAARTAAPSTVQTVAPTAPNARIERAGSERWLSVDVSPEEAFKVVREFWPSVGLAVEKEDAQAGIVETVWAENRAKLPQDIIRRTIGRVFDGLYSTGEMDKFRTRIERTSKNTAEIFISHRGMVEVYSSSSKDQTVWQPSPPDPQLEAEMLQRLLARFAPAPAAAAVAAAAPAQPAASTPTTPEVSRLVTGADGRVQRVDISEPFDRAWRRVGLALDRGGFTVEDRDRARGVYFVRYLDPDYEARQRDKQGFFSRLFGRDPKIEPQQFRVVVAEAGAGTTVSVLDKDGKADTGGTAQKILSQINEQLK
jgi:outer membrane protein assembly factor BamC